MFRIVSRLLYYSIEIRSMLMSRVIYSELGTVGPLGHRWSTGFIHQVIASHCWFSWMISFYCSIVAAVSSAVVSVSGSTEAKGLGGNGGTVAESSGRLTSTALARLAGWRHEPARWITRPVQWKRETRRYTNYKLYKLMLHAPATKAVCWVATAGPLRDGHHSLSLSASYCSTGVFANMLSKRGGGGPSFCSSLLAQWYNTVPTQKQHSSVTTSWFVGE